MPSAELIEITRKYFTALNMTDLVTILDFDVFIVDKFNLANNCPTYDKFTRLVDQILSASMSTEDKCDEMRKLIHDIHREVCGRANLHLVVNDMPDSALDASGEAVEVNPETVCHTLGVSDVIKIGAGSYMVACSIERAQFIADRINEMQVGDNIIQACAF